MTAVFARWVAVLLTTAILLSGCADPEDQPPRKQVTGLPDFSTLVEVNSPSVVNVTGVRSLPSLSGASEEENPHEWLRGLFGEDSDQLPGPLLPRENDGSGFILSEDGYIATNAHVIDSASKVFVRLSDGRELAAEVVGVDNIGDIALLKVQAKGLPPVSLGDSDDVRPGQWALAIGSPYGFDQTVTAGIISGVGRHLPSETTQPYVPFIQSDVAINPGNSGGPLFNTSGQVIGINAQIFTESGAFNGISFAIPINYVVDVIRQIKETGQVKRGFLGVEARAVDRELADRLGMEHARGAEVVGTIKGSPADKSALMRGDVILGVNGVAIADSADLTEVLGSLMPGSLVSLHVRSGSEEHDVDVVLSGLPDIAPRPDKPDAPTPKVPEEPELVVIDPLGMILRPLEGGGVRIGELDPKGPAKLAGLMTGDRLISIDRQPVENLSQAYRLIARIAHSRGKRGNDLVLFLVEREGEKRFFMPAFSGNPHQSD
ncbi:trypsin-like peptidase domain-containing protein [Guyparkeria hydrothermalis]|uniref:trypsin-like peptidase domain-containing protein n=1 Tax=Guyparkeria hydrothermalis TaxID=923 RepID=UPI002021A4D7|nr:trypsin-like peptidase domain-containing protein [Guyparkeria hydrothermalis]MCL7743826.1 trypsin-like peptidase domain-containing protein [Guyparkeria hydrothermalis]